MGNSFRAALLLLAPASTALAQSTETLDPLAHWSVEAIGGGDIKHLEREQGFLLSARRALSETRVGLRVLAHWVQLNDIARYHVPWGNCTGTSASYTCDGVRLKDNEQMLLFGGGVDASLAFGSIRFVPSVGVGIMPWAHGVQDGTVCHNVQPGEPVSCPSPSDTTTKRATEAGTYATLGLALRVSAVIVQWNAIAVHGAKTAIARSRAPIHILLGVRF